MLGRMLWRTLGRMLGKMFGRMLGRMLWRMLGHMPGIKLGPESTHSVVNIIFSDDFSRRVFLEGPEVRI